MVIKKFLFWLSISSLIFITACETFQENVKTNRDEPVITEETNNPIDPQTNQPVIKDPNFTARKSPKLGVILGGGGVLSYAHVGVLHELSKNKINIHSIVGIEWGALVAGTFSKTGRAHEVEWQLLKLPYKKFTEKGMFGSKEGGVTVDKFNDFLSSVFKKHRVGSAKIPFACPFLNIKKSQSRMSKKVFYKNVVKACWPHPPQFSVESVAADIMDVEKSVAFLRNQGAELILYVDVIGNNVLMTSNYRKNDPKAAVMWLHAKNFSSQIRNLGVNEVLSLPLSGGNLTSYDSMRMMVRMGQLKSRGFIKKMAKRYGY
ncbi:MAG: hypothetical protein HRT44_07400 [Bdellovibrionales bacterium]|nr:hypothetical protein [Bdellovibrionales bacterium]NQZ19063.1 hypothetical protein [Bdellovibrionales bacterium]